MLGGERAEGAGSPTLQGRNFILFVPASPSFRVLQKGNEKKLSSWIFNYVVRFVEHRRIDEQCCSKSGGDFNSFLFEMNEAKIWKYKEERVSSLSLKFRSIELLDEELLNRQLEGIRT